MWQSPPVQTKSPTSSPVCAAIMWVSRAYDAMLNGTPKTDRTGTGTRSVFGRQLRFDLAEGFPLVTTKRVHFKSIAYEPCRNQSSSYAIDLKCTRFVVTSGNPSARSNRNWRPNTLVVPVPVRSVLRVPCSSTSRSRSSYGVAIVSDIASYALLTHMIAAQTGLEVGDFVWTGGDCHIYDNHVEQVRTQLERAPYAPPTLRFARTPDSVFDYEYDDFVIEGYQHHPALRAAVAV